MKILAIDTSNYPLGIALLNGEVVEGEYITHLKKNHSVRAMPAIDYLLEECGTLPTELDKIVVAKGPGSYTGVRIGVTIAKTLAWTLNIPLVGVSSLEVLASVGRYFNGYVSPLFDARRGQIYTGLYKVENGRVIAQQSDVNILTTDWAKQLDKLNSPILFVGNDVSIHKEALQEVLGDHAQFAAFTEHNPRPSELAYLGMDKPNEDVHAFVPNYIRMVEAEVNWLEGQKNISNRTE